MILTDTHAHLFAEEFDTDRDSAVQRALSNGVKRIFLPNIDSTSVQSMLALSKKFPENCFPMIGLHPCSVNENFETEIKNIERWLAKEKFYAIGETGLDYYWEMKFAQQQKIAFSRQVEISLLHKLPIVIHTRTDRNKTNEDAFHDVVSILQGYKNNIPKGIFHCFTGNTNDAEKIIQLGFYMGIGGAVTFKNSKLPEVIEKIDLKHIVLETDSPYISPVPFRGKRNESSYLVHVAQKIAEIKKISVQEVAEITTENSKIIFGI